MRPEERNPLDLNNLPGDDYSSRDHHHGKQLLLDDTSSPPPGGGHLRKKKNGKDESGKVYECRFCSLKFCKSQALGGHMNRHRQERETETLNRARHLVFANDNLISPVVPPHHLLGGQPITHGGHHHHHQTSNPYRSVYPAAGLFSGSSSSTIISPPPPPPPPPLPQQSYMYPSPPRLVPYPPSHYNNNPHDYFVGHVLSGSGNTQYPNYNSTAPPESNYTCIGAPVGHGGKRGLGAELGGASGGGGGGRDMSPYNNYSDQVDEGVLNMNMNIRGRNYQDGF